MIATITSSSSHHLVRLRAGPSAVRGRCTGGRSRLQSQSGAVSSWLMGGAGSAAWPGCGSRADANPGLGADPGGGPPDRRPRPPLHGYTSSPGSGQPGRGRVAWLGQSSGSITCRRPGPTFPSICPSPRWRLAGFTSLGQPWLDHPPLLGCSSAAPRFSPVSTRRPRSDPPPSGSSILLSITSGWLLYVLAARHLGRATAWSHSHSSASRRG